MKNQNKNYHSLQGKFLISSPNINDSVFKKSLIYIISDNEDGSMGIIVNKPAQRVNLTSLLGKNIKNIIQQPQVYYGGPVELDKGFILHTNDYANDKNHIKLDNGLILSSDFSTIKEIALGKGPSKSILALGYTGWSSFQLHAELKKNVSLIDPFWGVPSGRWQRRPGSGPFVLLFSVLSVFCLICC